MFKKWFVGALSGLAAFGAFAQDNAPDALIKQVTEEVLSIAHRTRISRTAIRARRL